ncbi:hypothetical protein ACU4GR_23845 [Methylobacterium oryzae CBMB20]
MNNGFYGKFCVHPVVGGRGSSSQDVARPRRLRTVAKLGLAAACALGLAACVTPQERHAMDQDQCYAFGFEPGTDGFAECMMGLHQERAAAQASRDLSWQARVAEQNRRREAAARSLQDDEPAAQRRPALPRLRRLVGGRHGSSDHDLVRRQLPRPLTRIEGDSPCLT